MTANTVAATANGIAIMNIGEPNEGGFEVTCTVLLILMLSAVCVPPGTALASASIV